MEPLGDDVQRELRRLGPNAAIGETVAAWPDAVGDVIARNAWPARYQRDGTHQYTQREASKLVKRLPGADVLICHCPPLGINDDPDDPAHIGFEALREWVDRHRPRYVLHGHTHPLPGRALTRYGDTQVRWISGAQVLDLH